MTAPDITVAVQPDVPKADDFLSAALDGLNRPQKTLPCKFFYDERGSELFEQICEQPEYYQTRTELAIMEQFGSEMAARIGPCCLVIEFGSGASLKTRILLDRLEDVAGYVPIDISREQLERSAKALRADYAGLEVHPLLADYTANIDIPETVPDHRRRLVYFPGSTIGNFFPEDAAAFLRRLARLARHDGGILVGVDLKKDASTLERAYNDAAGVTAEFNLNILRRMNAELGSDFDLDAFEHGAVYNERFGRIEMHLVSTTDQTVRLTEDHTVAFEEGESIRTECSYKYSSADFAELARNAGLISTDVWTDAQRLFSVHLLTVP